MKDNNDYEKSMEYYKDTPKYKVLRNKLYELALVEFMKIKGEFSSTFTVGLHPFPIGYVGICDIVESDDLFGSNFRYFWIDCEGNKSELFEDKWAVYHNAKLNLPGEKQFTDEEKELIRKYDPHFGKKNKPKSNFNFTLNS